jgi:hypothetical protein
MDGMERSDVSKAWIGLTVRARIRTRRGGQYLVMGKLVEVDEEGIKIMGALVHPRSRASKTRASIRGIA